MSDQYAGLHDRILAWWDDNGWNEGIGPLYSLADESSLAPIGGVEPPYAYVFEIGRELSATARGPYAEVVHMQITIADARVEAERKRAIVIPRIREIAPSVLTDYRIAGARYEGGRVFPSRGFLRDGDPIFHGTVLMALTISGCTR